MDHMKVAVIGNGALTLGVAGIMAQRNVRVTYIDPCSKSEDMDALRQDPVLHFTGAANFDAKMENVTRDISAASEADIIVVSTPPSQRDDVFPQLAAVVRSGQHLLFFPATFGALAFSSFLKDRVLTNVTLSESVSYPYVCDVKNVNTIFIQSIKQTLGLAVLPKSRSDEMLSLYNKFFDIYTLSNNCLETSLDNINLTLHPLPVLLNLGAMDSNPSEFRHYIDGVTPHVAKLMELVDTERMTLGKTLGVSLTSTLDQLKQFYGETNARGIGEYVSSPSGPYPKVKGFGLNSRYITEDIPYLLVAMETLGQMVGVKTPITSLTIDLACAVTSTDYRSIGYSIDKLNLSGKDAANIISEIEASLGR